MKYKVLQRFITKTNVYVPGDVYQVDDVGKFTQRLLQYGFIKKVSDISFERWEKEGIRSKLANVIIAPENYTDGEKDHFTWEEAMDLEKSLPDGWRLPTRQEWALIAEEFANDPDTDELNSELLQEKLCLSRAGYVNSSGLNNAGSNGYYWSRTAYSNDYAYLLAFSSSSIYPPNSLSKHVGFSVRLVKEIK